jgi:hypothetical protein
MSQEETLEVLLKWDVANVDDEDHVILHRKDKSIEEGKLSGSRTDRISALPGSVTYILTAQNRFGQSVSQEVTVVVELQK